MLNSVEVYILMNSVKSKIYNGLWDVLDLSPNIYLCLFESSSEFLIYPLTTQWFKNIHKDEQNRCLVIYSLSAEGQHLLSVISLSSILVESSGSNFSTHKFI